MHPDSSGFMTPGGTSTPASGVSLPGGSSPLPPPAAPPSPFQVQAEVPTPSAGTPTGASGLAGGIPVPPPGPPGLGVKPPEPPKSGLKKPPAKPTAGSSKPAAVGAGQGKAPSKSPLILVGVIGLLLVVVVGIVVVMMMRSGSEPEKVVEVTPPPVTEQPVTEPQPEQPVEEEIASEPEPEQPPGQQAQAVPPPQIASFAAEQQTINQGESTRLRWASSNTNYVQINPGLARGPATGQHTVTPIETTKYTLIARGYGGRIQREVTVTVMPRQAVAQQPQPGSTKPNAWTLDALVRALESGEDVVKMTNLMVRVGLNGVAFAVTPDAQAAILAAGDRGKRSREDVGKIIELARKSSQR
ncbi:MAG: hypothetical protein KIT83_03245 [Bryobacterales bacterium]|nr:hypothetical protein [Bryobacterales bacterium]